MKPMAPLKLCTSCRHYRERRSKNGKHLLARTCHALDRQPSPIGGTQITGVSVELMRVGICGWERPTLWEAKRTGGLSK